MGREESQASLPIEELLLSDPRLLCLPLEHIGRTGISPKLSQFLETQDYWSTETGNLLNRSLELYWIRKSNLAERLRDWGAPRLRHVAIIHTPNSVHPFIPLLNTNAWTLYDSDLDPAASNPEFLCYLFLHSDRTLSLGEVTVAAMHNAAYWFDREADEIEDFAKAAFRSKRPDAQSFQRIAEAIPWLSKLFHEDIHQPKKDTPSYRIRGTPLSISADNHQLGSSLVQGLATIATEAQNGFYYAHSGQDDHSADRVMCWLAETAPQLVITNKTEVVWERSGNGPNKTLESLIKPAPTEALNSIRMDLEAAHDRINRFYRSLTSPSELRHAADKAEQSGYTYLHKDHECIAYNLSEPGIERLRIPALPYARDMLGARTLHELAHSAVESGWMRPIISDSSQADLIRELEEELETTVAKAPRALRQLTLQDLQQLAAGMEPKERGHAIGRSLVHTLLSRVPDYQANLIVQRLARKRDVESYFRHNVRSLHPHYRATQYWRMFIRYLYEYQYLHFLDLDNEESYFFKCTGFEQDFIESGVLPIDRFRSMGRILAQICRATEPDPKYFRFE